MLQAVVYTHVCMYEHVYSYVLIRKDIREWTNETSAMPIYYNVSSAVIAIFSYLCITKYFSSTKNVEILFVTNLINEITYYIVLIGM